MQAFYGAVAGLCFALLGLWWVVIQFKYAEWMLDRRYRRMAYDISLFFILPGLMSLVSLIGLQPTWIWRTAFTSAATIGAVETLLTLAGGQYRALKSPLAAPALAALCLIFCLIVAVALRPQFVADLGINLRPVQVEGILISLLLFVGVHVVWFMFSQSLTEMAQRESAGPGAGT